MDMKWNRVIWDIFPEDFNQDGHLHQLIKQLKEINFDQLVTFELNNVHSFLGEWTKQLNEENRQTPIYSSSDPIDLTQLFRLTPKLSGVLYLSHNYVLSESLFQENPQNLQHLTDRIVHPAVQTHLPFWKDLTFSFPRKYQFEGFYNSWGFIRIERKDSQGNDAGILISVNTLDSRVMDLMKKHHFEHLADLYNHAWDGAIHDYIHHIALYTNPSFGIGKRSPMSLANEHAVIDRWGTDMLDTFNYEYWAHRTHRLITERILTDEQKKMMISNARNYFKEVFSFLKVLLREKDSQFVQRISNYLVNVYMWPIHILMHPFDPKLEELTEEVNRLRIDQNKDLLEEVSTQIQAVEQREKPPYGPRAIALNETIRGLRLKEKIEASPETITWFDVMRLSTDMIVQRGVYEGWFHDQQVLYQNQPIHPNQATLHMLRALQHTLPLFEEKSETIRPYTLKGIVP